VCEAGLTVVLTDHRALVRPVSRAGLLLSVIFRSLPETKRRQRAHYNFGKQHLVATVDRLTSRSRRIYTCQLATSRTKMCVIARHRRCENGSQVTCASGQSSHALCFCMRGGARLFMLPAEN